MGLFNHRHTPTADVPLGGTAGCSAYLVPNAAGSQYPQMEVNRSYGSNATCTYAAVELAIGDRIRVIGFPGDIIAPLDNMIRRTWVKGVQKAGPYDPVCFGWKLSGEPWGYTDPIPARRLLINLLNTLATNGWHLAAATDIAGEERNRDTLIFKSGPSMPRFFFAVMFHSTDKLRLIDAPNESVRQGFLQALQTWPLGIQETKEKELGCFQIKMRGNPWGASDGKEVNQGKLLTCMILSVMDQHGFELARSIRMTGDGDDADMDTWFFCNRLYA